MLFGGLETISYNINRKQSDLKLFEFGKSYHKLPSGYEEPKHLALFSTGNNVAESWNTTQKPSDFFEFKGYVNSLLERLGITNFHSQPVENDIFSEGISFYVGNELLVELGILKKTILKSFDIKQEVCYAGFKWDAVLKMLSTKIKFNDITKFPVVRRDLALLVNNSVSFETIYNLVKQVDKSLIQEVSLFDVYQGDKLPEGKKSYAIKIKLQDANKTLTDVQIDKIMSKIQKQLESELDAQLR